MKKILTLLLLACGCIAASAQTTELQSTQETYPIYERCEQAYNIGRFDEAEQLLKSNMRLFGGTIRVAALRLLALCCIYQDQTEDAQKYTEQLLKEEPFFSTALEDNQRFIDMVEELKKGTATIISASQLAETLEEVPVPTTLITEEMIRESGAKNLAELLCLYVPGMSIVESEDLNVTMHGAYSLLQEKMLVMLNGHRLNSFTTNSESLDFRNSLDKIKQIEVLRGPASSLYGNVALTAVINIITKQGQDVDGFEIKGGIGNNGTYKGNFLFGKRYMDVDFMAWGSFYSSNGEKRYVKPGDEDYYNVGNKPGYFYINRFNETPSYDFGITAKYNKFSFLLSHQKSKKVLTYSNLFQSGIYSYDLYNKIEGNKPGTAHESSKIEVSYDNQWNNLFLQIKASVDVEKSSKYNACGDSLSEANKAIFDFLLETYGYIDEAESRLYPYEFQYWNSYTFSSSTQFGYNYHLGQQKGTLLFGIQYNRFVMNDTYYMMGENDKLPCYPTDNQRALLLGKESNASGYLQIKQNILPNLIFNGGLRFDRKHQFNKKTHNAWSPRLSLIWNPNKHMNLKVSYAHSFVDAPYLCRANTTFAYAGGNELNPEKMDALQLNFTWNVPRLGLNLESNVFYNNFSELITLLKRNYVNGGSFKIAGFEQTLSYHKNKHTASLNMTYQRVLESDNYNAQDHYVFAVPNIMAKLIYNVNLFQDKPYGALAMHANLSYNGKSRIYNRITVDKPLIIKDNIIANAGLEYNWKLLTFTCDIYNIFNTNYHRGGSFSRPIPQLGRNIIASLKIKL